MVDSSEQYCDTSRLELGTFRTTWNNGAALSDYLKTIFPTDRDNILNHKDSEQSKEIKRKLNAVNLERTLGITIIPTSDIQSHLRWNRTTNILEVYHFTSFLKEQLRVTKNEKDCEDFVSALHLLVEPCEPSVKDTDADHGTTQGARYQDNWFSKSSTRSRMCSSR
jgi:hypothetical protein